MVRSGGLGYRIDISKPIGQRISEMTLLKTGQPIDPGKGYAVAGWASVNEGTEGPPIWNVIAKHLESAKVVAPSETDAVQVVGA
jgi:sulfur-oxidizing protein SoxB